MHHEGPAGSIAPVRIEVYIQPRASRTEIAATHDGTVKIRVAAPAVENAANRSLIEFVAKRLGVAKRCVRIVAGTTGRRKILQIEGVSADALRDALAPTVRSPTR